jgi:Bacterial PH domain
VEEPAEDIIRGELSPSERLLWAGRPRQGIVVRAIDAFLIPFSLLWGGFAIFWEVSVIVGGAPWFFSVWGVPFVLVGLYIIFGRFWVDARQRAQTIYAVTSERVVIVSGVLARRTKSLNLATISDLSLTERGDDSGTITFGPVPPFYWWYGAAGWPGLGHTAIPSFELADEARRVYEIVREAQRAAK